MKDKHQTYNREKISTTVWLYFSIDYTIYFSGRIGAYSTGRNAVAADLNL